MIGFFFESFFSFRVVVLSTKNSTFYSTQKERREHDAFFGAERDRETEVIEHGSSSNESLLFFCLLLLLLLFDFVTRIRDAIFVRLEIVSVPRGKRRDFEK